MRGMLLLVGTLGACSVGPDATLGTEWAVDPGPELPLPPSPPPLELTVSPLVPGEAATWTVVGALPHENIHIGLSRRGLGRGPCSAQAGGLCFDIRSKVSLLARVAANASGVATFTDDLPSGLPVGEDFAFQALAIRGAGGAQSAVSNAVLATIEDASTDTDTDSWTPPVDYFTPTLDGDITDWPPGTVVSNTSGSGVNRIAWDADNLYVAAWHSDVASGGASHWFVIYVDNRSGTGSTTGLTFNTQTPGLATPVQSVLRWKADDSYDSFESWNGTDWGSSPGFAHNGPGGVAESNLNSAVEFRIPRTALGVVDDARVFVAWVYEGAGFESTYGASPMGSLNPGEGYDPDFQGYLQYDLAVSGLPTAVVP